MNFRAYVETLTSGIERQQYTPYTVSNNDNRIRAEIISAIPTPQAAQLLTSLNIKSITKKNIEKFRRGLIDLVKHISPAVTERILNADANFLSSILNVWKPYIPRIKLQTPRLKDIEDEPIQQPQQQIPRDKNYFPEMGSDLKTRLDWAKEKEDSGQYNLFQEIMRHLFLSGVKTNWVKFDEYHEKYKILQHWAAHELNSLSDIQTGVLTQALKELTYGYLKSLSNEEFGPQTLMNLIDFLKSKHLIRIKADELAYLAKLWQEKLWQGKSPKLTDDIISKLVNIFDNQQMHDWNLR